MKLKVQLEQANTRVDTVGVEAEQRLTLLTNQVDELSRTLEEHNREQIVSNRQLVEKVGLFEEVFIKIVSVEIESWQD
jgi:hypothetical protein